MKKIINILLLITFALLLISCDNDIDNYGAPNGGIKGTIYDAETNEPIPLPVQGNAGVLINLYEQNTDATKSIDFRAKQDGTFENSQLFNCSYKIVANGPFADKCEGLVEVKGQTEYNLKTIPFARASIEATVDKENKVIINYTTSPSRADYEVEEVSIMWNFAPGVDINTSNYATRETSANINGRFVFDLPNNDVFKENHYKIQANKNKIYVRVAAHTDGAVNYSKIVELTIN